MNALHELTEGDVNDLSRILIEIKNIGEAQAENSNSKGFRIYKLARDGLEILAFDRISRDTLAKLTTGQPMFQGYAVTEVVLDHIKSGRKINAIKEFRGESGLGLKEAKDWVEDYIAKNNLHIF